MVNPWVPTDRGPELVLTFHRGREIAPRPPEFDESILPGSTFEVIVPGWTGVLVSDADWRIELLGWTGSLKIRADRRLTPDGCLAAAKLGLLELASEVNCSLTRRYWIGYDCEIQFLEALHDTELAEAASWALKQARSKQYEYKEKLRREEPDDGFDE